MMKLGPVILASVMLATASAANAQTMNVQIFLQKAEGLQKKGPMALFSSDLKLLTNQAKADFGAIRQERLAAKAAGQPMAFCPPAAGAKLTDKDIVGAMRAVPPAQRAGTSTRDALKAMMVRRYPCP